MSKTEKFFLMLAIICLFFMVSVVSYVQGQRDVYEACMLGSVFETQKDVFMRCMQVTNTTTAQG